MGGICVDIGLIKADTVAIVTGEAGHEAGLRAEGGGLALHHADHVCLQPAASHCSGSGRAISAISRERESCAGDLSRYGTCALSIRRGFHYCQRGSRDAGEKQETATVV